MCFLLSITLGLDCHLSRAKFKFTDHCLLSGLFSVPSRHRYDIHLMYVRQSTCWKHCVFSPSLFCMFNKFVLLPKLIYFSLADLPKSSLWSESGGSIYNHGAHGHLGILCCWRKLPELEALPALPRQGLSSLQPTLQITSDSWHLQTAACVFRGSTTEPCSKKLLPLGTLKQQNCLAWNCPVLSHSSLWKSCSVACSLAAHLRHLGKQRLMLLGFSSRLDYPGCVVQLRVTGVQWKVPENTQRLFSIGLLSQLQLSK